MAPRVSIKGKEKQSRVAASDDERSDDDLAAPPKAMKEIDVQYRFQPLDNSLGPTRIKGLITELDICLKDLKKSLDVITKTARDVGECLAAGDAPPEDGSVPEDPDMVKVLDKEYRNSVDKQAELDIRMKVLSDLRQDLAQSVPINDILKKYDDNCARGLEAYNAKTSRQKYMDHDGYVDFRTSVWDIIFNGAPVPDIKKFIPAEEGDEDDDDDLEVGAQAADFKCPITITTLKDPVRSTKCIHMYSGEAIREHIRMAAPGPADCPVTGCPEKLTLKDLREDEHLTDRVARFVERQTQEKATQAAKAATQFEEIDDDSEDEE